MKFNMTTMIDLKGEKKQENKKKQKEIAKGIKKFKTHSFLSKVQLWIPNYLLTSEHLETDIQFNLQENTKHLFQFNNGAFNFKTEKLEPRTREKCVYY